jgi:SAM-dependent methyltransferase
MRNCFICEKPQPKKLLLSTNECNIVRCDKCNLIYDDKAAFIETKEDDIYSDGLDGHYSSEYIKQVSDQGVHKEIEVELMKNIRKYIRNASNKKFLDIGSSVGKFLEEAIENGFEPYGVEISKKACDIAIKNLPDAEIFCGEIFDAKYPDEYFDVINISAVLVHSEDPKKFLQEIYRILKPGGYLFIDDNCYNYFRLDNFIFKLLTGEQRDYKWRLNFFTIKTFNKFISATPFKIVTIYRYGFSDKIIHNFIPMNYKKNFFIKIILYMIRIIKPDKIIMASRIFQAVLVKKY